MVLDANNKLVGSLYIEEEAVLENLEQFESKISKHQVMNLPDGMSNFHLLLLIILRSLELFMLGRYESYNKLFKMKK